MSKKSRRRKRVERLRAVAKAVRRVPPVKLPLTLTVTADAWFRIADVMMRTDPPDRVRWTAWPAAGCKTADAVTDFLRGNAFRVSAHGWYSPLWPGVYFDLPPTPDGGDRRARA